MNINQLFLCAGALALGILVNTQASAQTTAGGWTNRYNGPGNGADKANALAVDGSGNVVVTGSSTGSSGSYDYVTIKYSGAGVPLWTNRYRGSGNLDLAKAVAVNTNGNVFVMGYSWSGSSYD